MKRRRRRWGEVRSRRKGGETGQQMAMGCRQMRAEAVRKRERRVRKRRVRRLVRKVQRREESAERVQVQCQEEPRDKCHGAQGYTCCTGQPVL